MRMNEYRVACIVIIDTQLLTHMIQTFSNSMIMASNLNQMQWNNLEALRFNYTHSLRWEQYASFFKRELGRGPFVPSLADLCPNNISIDEGWKITCPVALRVGRLFADLDDSSLSSAKIDMLRAFHRLKSLGVDQLGPSEYRKFGDNSWMP